MTPPSLLFPLVFLILIACAAAVAAWFFALDARDLPYRTDARASAARDAVLAGVAALFAALSAWIVALALPA